MSSVNSLLKYRYQKKSSADANSSLSSSASSQDSGDSVTNAPVTNQVIQTKQLLIPPPAENFSSRSSGSSKSEPAVKTNVSPWLSKERGIMEEGGRKKFQMNSRVRNAAYFESSDEEGGDGLSTASSTSLSSTTDQRDLEAKVHRLADMFPDVQRARLEEAVNYAGGDLDKAVDHVIRQKNEQEAAENKRKRKLAFYQSSTILSPERLVAQPPLLEKIGGNGQNSLASPDSSPACEPPVLKRARPLYFSDESPSSSQNELTSLPAAAVTVPSSNESIPFKPLDPDLIMDFQAVEERIRFLGEAFPNISKRELKRVLTENKFDVEASINTFATYRAQANLPPLPASGVSQTTNVGSIKAYIASREQAKVVAPITSPEAATENENKKIERRRVIVHDDDDDDEDAKYKPAEKDDSKSMNTQILDFFNVATVEEMQIMNGCSRKKAELIIKLRPFADWGDLVSKIESHNSLPHQLLSEGREVIRLRSTVQSLMERCRRLSIEQEQFVSDLANRTSMDALANDRNYIIKQPSILSKSMTLAPYQMVGLNWLILMHGHQLNGILGDEMGLGKTIQTIAFFAHLYMEGIKGPHVVVAPSSTIDNWLREMATWCPELKVLLYYGSQDERRSLRCQLLDGNMDEFHVMLTTYNIATGSVDDRALFKKVKFNYAVFDEGHMLKNMTSMRYRSLMRITSRRRLLLTGTPLQNNLIELMSLLVFLMPDMFVGKTDILKRIFATFSNNGDTRGTYELETLTHAKQILKPFFLRRLKSEVLQQLPTKVASVVRVPMSFEQQDLYDELLGQFARNLETMAESNVNGGATTGQSGASVMMALRKAANHHLLHRHQFDDARLRQMAQLMLEEPTHREANVDYVFEDMQVMSDFELHRLCNQYRALHPFRLDTEQITDSGKFRHLDEVLPAMKSKGDRVLLFSQFTMMLDIVEEYLTSRRHKYIRLDGSTPVVERQDLIDRYNTDESIFIFLLSTKAGGLGINLTAANVVILHDIDFNPYNDKQAEDRCHRVGQTRDVQVFRLISKNSIEEAMLRCAEAKLKLESDVTGNGSKDCENLESNDVASLLKEALEIGKNS